MSTRLSRFGDRLFELLVVAAPGDLGSRLLSIFLSTLIVLNVLAQALQAWWPFADLWPGFALETYLLWFERGSLAIFALEYLARLLVGHTDGARADGPRADGERGGASVLKRIAHPLMLVDLLVLLAFAGSRWWQIDLRLLRFLRLPDLLARLSRSRTGRELAEGEVPFASVQQERNLALAEIRRLLAESAQEDLSDLRKHLRRTTHAVRQVQQGWLLSARRDLQQARAEVDATRSKVDEVLDELEAQMSSTERLDTARQAVQTAYADSGKVYDEVPDGIVDVRDLSWRGRLSYRRVPARAIGQHHFQAVSANWEAAFASFSRVYRDGLRDSLAGVRSAMGFPFDMVEKGDVDVGSTTQLQAVLSRAVNRCRDLDEPARAAWEQTQWGLEVAHVIGIELVEADTGRVGLIEFYLGRMWRGVIAGLRFGMEAAHNGVTSLGPPAWLRIVGLYNEVLDYARPSLEWIGLMRPPAAEAREQADQARLESVLQRGLPEDYLRHFDMTPLADDTLLVGFDSELAEMDRAIERWESGQPSSFIVHGPRGGGKTSLLNVAERRLFEESDNVVRDVIVDKIVDQDALALHLARLFGVEATDIREVALALLAGPRRAIILEGCHNLYLRRIGGLGGIRQLLWLVARTNHHVLWGLCLEENAKDYLAKILPFDRLFHFDIGIGAHSGPELRRLIMQRHNLSGYRLRYADGPTVRRALRRRVRRYQRVEEPAVQEALASIFFEELAETCVDNTTVAQFYWLRSLEVAGPEMYKVTPHEPIDLDLVRGLSLDAAYVLAAILQHDNLTADELTTIVDRNLVDVRLELEILWNNNILAGDLDEERFRINAVALKTTRSMLRGRNLI